MEPARQDWVQTGNTLDGTGTGRTLGAMGSEVWFVVQATTMLGVVTSTITRIQHVLEALVTQVLQVLPGCHELTTQSKLNSGAKF